MANSIVQKIFACMLAIVVSSKAFSEANTSELPARKFGFGITASPIGSQYGLETSYRIDPRNSLVLGGDSSVFKKQYAVSFRSNFWKTFYLDLGLAYGSYTIFAGTDSYGPIETIQPSSAPSFAMTLITDDYGYTIERRYFASNLAIGNRMPLGSGIDLGMEWVGKTLPFKEYGDKLKYRRPDLHYRMPVEDHSKSEASLDNILTVYLGYSF